MNYAHLPRPIAAGTARAKARNCTVAKAECASFRRHAAFRRNTEMAFPAIGHHLPLQRQHVQLNVADDHKIDVCEL